jgi:hypothetical protein
MVIKWLGTLRLSMFRVSGVQALANLAVGLATKELEGEQVGGKSMCSVPRWRVVTKVMQFA